jgi:hypothetical protein
MKAKPRKKKIATLPEDYKRALSAKAGAVVEDYFSRQPGVKLSRLTGDVLELGERLGKFESAFFRRMVESDKLICDATEVLRTIATNMREARDQSRILDARVTARLDALGTAINGLGELLEQGRRGCLSVAEVVELVDVARKRTP